MCVRLLLVSLALVPVCVLPTVADTEEAPKLVTLTAQDTPAAEVAATIAEQAGVQVTATERTVGTVTGEIKDLKVEEAVSALALGIPGTYLRAYIIEPAPPEKPYSAEVLIQALQDVREWWLGRMTDEEREALFTHWRELWQQRREEQQAAAGVEGAPQGPGGPQGGGGPGGGMGGPGGMGGFRGPQGPTGPLGLGAQPEQAAPPAEGGEPGQGRRMTEDPLRGLSLPERRETITLDLQAAGPDEALAAFILASGYFVLSDPRLDGTISFSVQDAPLSDVLDGIAEGLGGTWREFYLVSQPYELTEEEREQRAEARFNQRWADYWALDAQGRAAELQERIGRLERMTQRIQEGGRGGRMGRRLPRMVQRTQQYALTLTADQRLELKPYLQALARAAGAVPQAQ